MKICQHSMKVNDLQLIFGSHKSIWGIRKNILSDFLNILSDVANKSQIRKNILSIFEKPAHILSNNDIVIL